LTKSFQPPYGPGVDSASNKNECQESSWGIKVGRCVRLIILPPSVSRFSGKYEILDVSQLYGTPLPVLHHYFICNMFCHRNKKVTNCYDTQIQPVFSSFYFSDNLRRQLTTRKMMLYARSMDFSVDLIFPVTLWPGD
jgi:hypothetical protein